MSRKNRLETSELFVGARLGAARERLGISLEQAARDTRIRVQRLREIETDDFSGFAHPTYARLFLLDYAAYLNVPQNEIRGLLPDQTIPATAGFQYLEALGNPLTIPGRIGQPSTRRRPKLRALIFGLLAIFAILFIAVFSWYTWRKIERLARTGTPAAETTLTPTPEPSPTPATAEPSAPTLWEITPEPSPTP